MGFDVPGPGMGGISNPHFHQSESGDHQRFNESMISSSIGILVGCIYHHIVFTNVMKRSSAQHWCLLGYLSDIIRMPRSTSKPWEKGWLISQVVISILIRSRDPENMRSLSQIAPAKVLKLTAPQRGMNENCDAPIVQPARVITKWLMGSWILHSLNHQRNLDTIV
jgi:hypothetical protein